MRGREGGKEGRREGGRVRGREGGREGGRNTCTFTFLSNVITGATSYSSNYALVL